MEKRLYQRIDNIPNIDQLQLAFDKILIENNITKMLSIKAPRFNFEEKITEFIKQNPHPVWDGLELKSGLFFFLPPDTEQGIHVDGFEADRAGASNRALNIPIRNCGIGSMDWFGGPGYSLEVKKVADRKANSKKSSTRYLKINWNGKPRVVGSVTIDVPYIVRIDVPHQAINRCKDNPRVMLSIRFNKDPKWV